MKPTLLVLAAGMGSRYGGVKQIDAVGLHNETLLDFATFDAKKSGFGRVVYIIRKDIEADFRERFFDRVASNFDAEYVFQNPDSLFTSEQLGKISSDRTKPWGTLHAVLCAEKAVKEPFTVINADDYYGRDAFVSIEKHLSVLDVTSTEHAMVGYVLKNTMSRSGSVSRGICVVKNDYLVSMCENTKISYAGDKIITEQDGKKSDLTGEELVSMNLFGFTPAAFEGFHAYWDDFITKNNSAVTVEALLPTAASWLVSSGKGKIAFYSSTEKWFGMTYPEDRAIVKAEIAAKIAENYYPEQLWERV